MDKKILDFFTGLGRNLSGGKLNLGNIIGKVQVFSFALVKIAVGVIPSQITGAVYPLIKSVI